MKLSLVTINRNNSEGLKRTLSSIAQQVPLLKPGDEIEHIIVDGQSTDISINEIKVEPYSRIINIPPKGVYNAINKGISESTGEIIGLLHSGDVFTNESILAQIMNSFSEECNKTDYIWGDVSIGKRYFSGNGFTCKNLRTGFAPPHPSLYIKRTVIQKVGFYNEALKTAADFDYFVRLAKDASLSGQYLPLKIVVMEPGGMSQRFINRIWTNNRERLISLKMHGMPSNYLRLLAHYKKVLKGYICSSKKK